MSRTLPSLLLSLFVSAGVVVSNGACSTAIAAGSDPPEFVGAFGSFKFIEPRKDTPRITFHSHDSGEMRIRDFAGELVLVNLWGTWCPPCVREMPALDRLQQHFRARPFNVVAICIECGGLEEVTQFFADKKIRQLERYWSLDFEVPMAFEVRGLPTSILVDTRGREIGRLEGDASWDGPQAIALIEYFLSEAPPP